MRTPRANKKITNQLELVMSQIDKVRQSMAEIAELSKLACLRINKETESKTLILKIASN